MNPLLWVIALLAVGLAVMVLEVFVPSGGVLGFVSVVALLAAVATAFMELGPMAGMTVLAITVVSVPTVLGLAFRWFPETPLGRRVLPAPPDVAEMLPDAPHRRRTRDLIGHRGRAVSDLLPWGSVAVAGDAWEAVSESGPISSGVAVEVVGVQGRALVVRPAEESAWEGPPGGGLPGVSAGPEGAAEGSSRLSPTLEAFEFERLDPPPA